MASQEEILKLRMQSNVDQEAGKASAALARVDAEVAELKASFARGGVEAGRYRERLAELTAEHNRLAASLDRVGKAQAGASRQGGMGMGRGGNMGQAAMQFSSFADDIQYGARGIQNNVAGGIMALGGYTAAASLAAGATSILIGVFREQIDQGLAWAGILDSNLVKGLDDGTAAADRLTTATERLNEALKSAPTAAREAGQTLGAAFEGGGAEGQSKLARQLIEDGFGASEIEAQREQVGRAKYLADRTGSRGAQRGFGAAQDDLQRMLAEREQAAARAVETLIADAAKGDGKAAARLSALARDAGQTDFAIAVDRQRGLAAPEVPEVGPTREMFEEDLERRADIKKLADEADKATGEARKLSTGAAFGGILAVEERVDQGILNRVGSGSDLGTASSEVAAALAAELQSSGGLPAEWAAEEARKYVDERTRALRETAAREELDPARADAEARDELVKRIEASKAENAMMGSPGVFDAGSFASQVQAGGAKDTSKLLEDQLKKFDDLIKATHEQTRALQRRQFFA